ncbi:M13 family metallopeptidase [Massilia sp. Dwa41.01b]|uniref:M13 family metallopeptidase n=1 Tax=unclassified Massilia TaxID=2609279 RepID=UPI0016044FAD|nr:MULTISPECIES: M13 family metallopeptidase [unclassified Massilia]QNA87911.1 M13 family metallopeptidase [Massilia sp. Dwa41.01b]QNA98814.1 M13 family metallopeptidase [Massilia sp. Se16.2.3]
MSHITRLALSLALAGSAAFACAQSTEPERPATTFPYTPGLDVNSMDKSADPCVDFYQYACGGWLKNNPVPADQARWSVYSKLAQDNQRYLWGILEGLAQQKAGRNATQQKIGDYFAACMDEGAIAKRGGEPLAPWLQQIDAMRSRSELPRVLAALQLTMSNTDFFFGFTSSQDFADSTRVIAFASAGGLGLPERDYYLKTDKRSKEIRAKYVAHLATMFGLIGEDRGKARRSAASVMRIETALARASLAPVEKRDPYKLFHKTDLKGLQAHTRGFDWKPFLAELGQPDLNSFNVTEPKFLRAFAGQLRTKSLADIKTYLRAHVLTTMAPVLSPQFDEPHFAFFSKTLRGVERQQPRWKRCVQLVDYQLGEALGQEFVSRAFSPELKAKSLHMTRQVEEAMAKDIESLDWMSADTKKRAREKLDAIVNKIGYPDTWRDYSTYEVRANDFAGNVVRGSLFENRRQLAKIGKPLDRSEWGMTPPTVNAYFNPQMNDINFPAGVLQPPLFDPKMDDAPNYGNTGGTIGHELTHAFDDEGRQFDAKGNLKDWWTKKDNKAFNERAQCIVDQYAKYTVVDNIKINSRLTLGEDVADLGGLILGWMAWKTQMASMPQQAQPKGSALRDGLSPEQRFFVGFAQWACENNRPESLRVSATTDPHSPGKYRINGVVINMPEFEKAFACKPGQPMAPVKRCRVW